MERLTLISSKIILSLFDNVRKGHFLVHKVECSFNQTKTDVSHCQTNYCPTYQTELTFKLSFCELSLF